MENTRHALEIGRGLFVGAAGFSVTLTSVDTVVKVLVGVATIGYLLLKCAEIIRDWNKPKNLSDSKPTTKD